MIEIKPLASGSRGNCYYVTDGVTPLLLECGIPYKDIQRGLDFRVSEVAGCLVSHEHQDHAKAVKDLLRAGIDCYMSQGTKEALGVSGHRIRIIRAREQFTLGSWTILPFDTIHDAAEPLGFLLANQAGERLLFATDTAYIKYRFRGLTHIMIEANYDAELKDNVAKGIVNAEVEKRIYKSHFSLANVKDFFKANDLRYVQEIWLLHLSDGNSNAERFKREIQELTGKMVFIA
ncbi:MAG: MBL fold metallo-hydrolase [Moorellaceae bacterium]